MEEKKWASGNSISRVLRLTIQSPVVKGYYKSFEYVVNTAQNTTTLVATC